MNDKITIERLSPKVISLQHSESWAALNLALLAGFFVIWYVVIFTNPAKHWFAQFAAICTPAIVIPPMLWFRQAAQGLTFYFDASRRIVKKNTDIVARFEEVEQIQIRTIHGGETRNDYRLSLVLRDGRKLRVGQTQDNEEITQAAEDIADLLQVTIHKK